MSFQKIDHCKLQLNDRSSRKTKYYYHPSKCPRSWPNYKACLNALERDRSLSRMSSRELQTYPRMTNNENPQPRLRENPGLINIIVTEDTRKTLRMRRSRSKNKSKVVSSSSDESLKFAFLNDYKYPNNVPKHLSIQQIMTMNESREKGKDDFQTACKNYCDSFYRRNPPYANKNPNNPPRRNSQNKDIYKSKTTIEAHSKGCGGYCAKFITGEHPSIKREGEEKPSREQEPRTSDLLSPRKTSFTLLKKPIQSYDEVQQKYKEGDALMNEKPFLLYQHPTDRATMTEIEELKRSQTANHPQENENNKASTSSQTNDKISVQEQTDEHDLRNSYSTREPSSIVQNSMGNGVRDQSTIVEEPLPVDRYSDSKPQNSNLQEENISRGNGTLMNGAVSAKQEKNFESVPSSSTDTDIIPPPKKPSLADDPSKKPQKRGCSCEENKIPSKQQNTSIQRGNGYPKYGSMKEMTANKLMADEDCKPCLCDEYKAKSRPMQPQESPMKEEKVDVSTQVSKQMETQTSEYKTNKRNSGVSSVSFGFGPSDVISQQSSPIVNSPQVLPPQQLVNAMKFDPTAAYMYPDPQTANTSSQFGLDQSAWRLPYSGARPEWRIIAPAQILGSSQFRSALPINNMPQYYGNNGFMLPQMVNRSQLTLHKVLNPSYLQQSQYSQPNIGCCSSKLSISTSGIEYHHRSARCSMKGVQNRSTQKLNPSMSLGGMPISAGIEPSNMSQGLLSPSALGSSDMTQIAMPVTGTDQVMMPGVSQMGGPSTNNGVYPVQGSMRGAPNEQMPYAYFPWAYRESQQQQQQRAISNHDKIDSVSIDTAYIPTTPRNTMASLSSGFQNDLSRQNMIAQGSNLQQERNNPTGYPPQGMNFYQPESYYPPQKSLSSSAAPYFSGGYSPECINKLKCRDPYCNQKPGLQPSQLPMHPSQLPMQPSELPMQPSELPMQPAAMAAPSISFYDPYGPYRNMRESQITSHEALNKSGIDISRQPSKHSDTTAKMVPCGPSKSCVSLHDKSIICSARAPLRMCARDPQAGIPCGPKKSAGDVSRQESNYQSQASIQSFADRSADAHRPTVESIMEGIMSNVTRKASRGCNYLCPSRVPLTIKEDTEDYRHSSARKSARGRVSCTSRGSHKSYRGSHGSSMQGYEHRGSGRHGSRPHQSYDKHKSSMDRMPSHMSYGGSRSSRGTSPGLGGRSFRGSHPSRTSRGTSPGLKGRSFGSRGSRGRSRMGPGGSRSGADVHAKRSRTSRGTSPGLGSKSFTGESLMNSPGNSMVSRSNEIESNGGVSMSKQSGQQPPSQYSNLASNESIRYTDRNSKYSPERQPDGSIRVSRKGDGGKKAFNPNTASESVKKEANAMRSGPGFTRTKARTAHQMQYMHSGDDENTLSNKPTTMNQKMIAQKPATTKGGAGDQGRASKNKSGITGDKAQAPKLKSSSEVSNQRQSQQKQQQRISQPPSQQRISQPPQQQRGSQPPSQERGSQPQQQRGSQPPSQQRGSQPPSQQRGSQPPSQQRGSQPPRQTTDEGTQMQEGDNVRRSTRESQNRSQNRGSQRESERQSKTSKTSVPGDSMHGGTSNEDLCTRYL